MRPDTLQRQDLVGLSPAGWQQAQEQMAGADADTRACLAHWARHGLPLVVTQQACAAAAVAHDRPRAGAGPGPRPGPGAAAGAGAGAAARVALGLPAPLCWQRRRIGLSLPATLLRPTAPFPALHQAAALLPQHLHTRCTQLAAQLAALGCVATVYGGHGWQWRTGLAYLHPGSDLDLLLPVHSPQQADAVAAELARWEHRPAAPNQADAPLPPLPPVRPERDERAPDGAPQTGGLHPAPPGSARCALPRLDGELLLPGGRAFSWREWQAWRQGHQRGILCKTLHGATLVSELASEALA